MKAWMRIGILLVGAWLLVVAAQFTVRQYRIAKSVRFCDTVEALPRTELEAYAARCDRLALENGGSEGELRIISDTDNLAQFALAGKRPLEIVVEKGMVGIKFFKGHWSYSTLALWSEGSSQNGEPIKVLKITYGTYGWRILCQRPILNDTKTRRDE